ncbi:MAG: carboxy-S-adenosyl-L-methionine synthase CmoA [Campylobacterales bacterium]|nr:carboxy-S-adenosyl-L-methionine synthase CmoA [Campylobacterales bacterium]
MKDKIFEKPITKQFEFDEACASVFDDMLVRSVPFYKDVINLTTDILVKNLHEGDIIYDLGCSTATTLIELQRKFAKPLELIGIDNSIAMIERAKNKAKAYNVNCNFICDDMFNIDFKKSNVFISNYTIQFIRPMNREKLVKKIYDSLKPNGIFIFSEKIISEDKILHKQLIDIYYDFKKSQGYSEYEIAQKREALENVLIPYTLDENILMAKNAGFEHVECIFRWLNFATIICFK